MDADFSIELGRDDPVLDFPWADPEGKLAYVDLKRHPERIEKIEEASKFAELAEFLRSVNSPRSVFESAKCDAWTTNEFSAEEIVFGASLRFSSYVDLVFSGSDRRQSLPAHEGFAKKLTDLLKRAPEIAASAEVCVRRCFFGDASVAARIREGFYFTAYVNGYGDDELAARKNWGIALNLLEHAILQLSVSALHHGT